MSAVQSIIASFRLPTDLSNIVDIATTVWHSMALRSDGTVATWGNDAPRVPAGLSNVVSVAAGKYHSAALKADGSVVVWGDNSYGQQNVPVGLANVVVLVSGDNHLLALGPAPILGPGGWMGGAFILTWEGLARASYSVWGSSNLVQWTQLGTATEPTPGRFFFADTDAPKWSSRFYQVRSP